MHTCCGSCSLPTSPTDSLTPSLPPTDSHPLPLTPSDSSNPLPPSLCHSTAVTQGFAQLCAVVLDTDPCTAFASWEVSAKCGEPENYSGTAVFFSTVHCNALSLLHFRGQMLRSIRVAAALVYRCILIECISELCISDRVDLKLVAGLSSIRVAFLHCGVSSIRAALEQQRARPGSHKSPTGSPVTLIIIRN